MLVTLIEPPWYYPDKTTVVSNNLGLGYIAAFLEGYGHQVWIIDALAHKERQARIVQTKYERVYRLGLDYQSIIQLIPKETQLIGLHAPFVNHSQIIYELSPLIKQSYPDVPLVVGGAYPSTLPEHALSCSGIDYIVVGEGEIAMLKLADGINPSQISGVLFKGKKERGISEVIEDLDELPFPARHLLPIERYFYFDTLGRRSRRRSLEVLTSRGCPFNCHFCATHPVFGYQFRVRSAQNVLAEIEQLISQYGVEHINFIDDNLSLDRQRMEQLLDGLIQNRMPISWAAVSGLRVDTLDREILEKIKASNCSRINLAIEHGDPKILKAMNKKLDLSRVKEVIRLCGQLGIEPRGYLIIGYPGESKESFLTSINYCQELRSLGMSTFILSIAQPYPQTRLFFECQENGYLTKPDMENVLFFSEYPQPNIITPDFDCVEIKRRFLYALKRFNPVEYWGSKLLPRSIAKRLIPKEIKDLIIKRQSIDIALSYMQRSH